MLRICEGVLPVPIGALCNGPVWKPLWTLSDLKARIETLLVGADATKAHFVQIAKDDHVLLVVWSLPLASALGLFYVAGNPADQDFDDDVTLTLASTADTIWRDKDATARWFASRIGDRVLLGNGIDANLSWRAGALALIGPTITPTDPYDKARVAIPPCTCFRRHVNGSVLAAGNAAQPLRIWITDAPNKDYPVFLGINSLDTSFIDLHPHRNATRITALSVYQQYVTAHTDQGPVNVSGIDTTADGWKCRQDPSAANASAPNPECVGDSLGDSDFFLGSDGEVYLDQAVRSGPYEKRAARDQDIATLQGAAVWNRDVRKPLISSASHTLYDRDTRLFWMWMRQAIDGRPALYLYNERTRTVAGPLRYPTAIVSCAMQVTTPLPSANAPAAGIGSMAIGSTFVVR